MIAKRILFPLVACLVPSLVLLGLAELGLRYHTTGGLVAALATFMPRRDSPAAWLIADPDVGYTLNPAGNAANSLGIRHAEIGPPLPGDPVRFLVLGDSVAWDTDGFVGTVAVRLSETAIGPVETINASIPGYTTYQQRPLFERDLAALEPKFVLLQYCLNDNHRFLHELDEGGYWVMVPDAARDREPRSRFRRWLEKSYLAKRVMWIVRARERSRREEADPFPWRNTTEFGNAWIDETWPEQERQIRAIRDTAARFGARTAVVVFPLESQLSEKALELDRAYTLKPQRMLSEIAARLAIPLLDLYEPFHARAGENLFRDGLHLTASGHEVAADQLTAFLETLGWFVAPASARQQR